MDHDGPWAIQVLRSDQEGNPLPSKFYGPIATLEMADDILNRDDVIDMAPDDGTIIEDVVAVPLIPLDVPTDQ